MRSHFKEQSLEQLYEIRALLTGAGKKYGFVAARLFNEQIIDQLLRRDQGVPVAAS